jgi:hypothetical protein
MQTTVTTSEKSLLWFGELEVTEEIKSIEWNQREEAFMKPTMTYNEFVKEYRHIIYSDASYEHYDRHNADWKKIASDLILEDREKFNDN